MMGEFGHSHGRVGNCSIDSWGKGLFEIEVADRLYRFEDSDMFGPHRLKANGDPHEVNFGQKSPFWAAHRLWVEQGRQVEQDGKTCIWREALPTIVQKIGNMHMVIQHGEPSGPYHVVRQVQIEAPKRRRQP